VYGQTFTTGRFDIGQKIGFLRANLEVALTRDDLGPDVRELLVELVRREGLV
jgi:UTP--glucose-1-phosphate uridylyltransferase